ncbi:MAG: coenzyme synthetase-like protein [Clostridia bacterium]|jgi:phenylacetate-coenzyme A ligase PaaK-like adenylate-forming protein|nr:coenzyme synthetase-like protein [Clostridia bacterium]
MKHTGIMKALFILRKTNKMGIEDIKKLQHERFKKLFNYGRENSEYLFKKYEGLAVEPNYSEIPISTKKELMENFNQWITDKDVTLEKVNAFMEDKDNIGRMFLGKYLVCTTSGSTGIPAVVLYDKTAMNVMDAMSFVRATAHKEDFWKLIKAGGKSAAIYATEGFYLGYSSVRRKQMQNPRKAKQLGIFSVFSPLHEIVSKLNDFQPALLGGYPTAVELLIEEKRAGRLKIHPVFINTGGEYLSPELAQELRTVFGCHVQTNYGSTEGGMMAFQCVEGHLHINSDWLIIEPVDENRNPVPDGVLSHAVLITNLSNFTQPIIRYEISDRVILYKEQCKCGNPMPYIEVEGRTDDILYFVEGEEKIGIAPLAIYALLKETEGIMRFQVVQHDHSTLELRLEFNSSHKHQEIAEKAIARVQHLLLQNGIKNVQIRRSNEPIARDERSGKFKHVIALKK